MKEEAHIMGMPIVIQVADRTARKSDIESVFDYFRHIDAVFSTYKETSEISKINRGEITPNNASGEVSDILKACEQTKQATDGYFDCMIDGKLDPSGVVKGQAILFGAEMLQQKGFKDIYVEIAGDIQTYGMNDKGAKWRVGIENPFNRRENIKIVHLSGEGIATSGIAARGAHIYNPKTKQSADEIASLTVIGPNIYDADRFATGAFAMGQSGLHFIESLPGFEAYMVGKDERAFATSHFAQYEKV